MRYESAVRWARVGYLAVLAAALLAPFGFRWDPASVAGALREAVRPTWTPADVVDAVRNLTLFAGWGLLWVTGRRRSSIRRLLLGAVGTGAVIGLAAEGIQLAVPGRTTSLLDVGTNAVGAGLGAVAALAVTRALNEERRRPTLRPTLFGVPASAVAASYLGAAALEVAFPLLRHAGSPGRYGAPGERLAWSLDRVGWESLTVLPVTEGLLLLPAGFLCALALWERGFERPRAVRWTVGMGVALSVLGELVHGPLGRPMELGPMTVHAAAVAAGGWLAGSSWLPIAVRRSSGRGRTAGFLMGYAVVLALWSWRPFVPELDPGAIADQFAGGRWLPLGALRVRRDLFSVADVLRSFLLFVPLGAVLAVRPLRRSGVLRGASPALCAALLLEFGQALVAGRFFDGTDVIVTGAGAGFAWFAVRAAGFPVRTAIFGSDQHGEASPGRSPMTDRSSPGGTESEPPDPRRALVTGGAVRVGRAIAIALGRAGWNVLVHYHRSEGDADSVVAEIRAAGGGGWAVGADLTEPEQITALFRACEDRLGGLELLVNNAARFPRSRPEEVRPEDWDAVFALNARAPFLCAVEAARVMGEAGGNIVNVADVAAFEAWPSYAPYAASKAALVSLTRSLAVAWAPRVRVNAVAPGPVLLPEDTGEEERRRAAESTALGRIGSPEDVAEAVLYLAAADFVTGEVLRVDGGEHVARSTG